MAISQGCSVDAPVAPIGHDMRPDLPGAGDNADLLPKDDGNLPVPVLDAPIKDTNYLSVPVQGRATPGVDVVIEDTAVNAISVTVQDDGTFCVDVQLKQDQTNVLHLYAADPHGRQSDKIALQIQQHYVPPPPPQVVPISENAALNGSGSSAGMYAHRNDENALFDGTTELSFGGRHTPFADSATMTVRLMKASRVERVMIFAPADCQFTAPFDIYTSTLDAPAGPTIMPTAWTKQPPTYLDLTKAEVDFATPIVATHVSVVWPYDGWSSAGLNCGSWALGPYYAIAEVEAWTQPLSAPVPPHPPACGK
jgi:hypothetical protein